MLLLALIKSGRNLKGDYISMNKKICYFIAFVLVMAIVSGLNYAVLKIAAIIPNMTILKLALLQALIVVLPSAIYNYRKLS